VTGPAPLVELIAGIVVIAIGVLIVRFADRIAAGMRRIRQAAARTPDVASESPVLVRAVAIGWLLLGGLLVVFGIGGLAGS
jgi:hypothetical protein